MLSYIAQYTIDNGLLRNILAKPTNTPVSGNDYVAADGTYKALDLSAYVAKSGDTMTGTLTVTADSATQNGLVIKARSGNDYGYLSFTNNSGSTQRAAFGPDSLSQMYYAAEKHKFSNLAFSSGVTFDLTTEPNTLVFRNFADTGYQSIRANQVDGYNFIVRTALNTPAVELGWSGWRGDARAVNLINTGGISWSSTPYVHGGADTGIDRPSASLIRATDGAGGYGKIDAGTYRIQGSDVINQTSNILTLGLGFSGAGFPIRLGPNGTGHVTAAQYAVYNTNGNSYIEAYSNAGVQVMQYAGQLGVCRAGSFQVQPTGYFYVEGRGLISSSANGVIHVQNYDMNDSVAQTLVLGPGTTTSNGVRLTRATSSGNLVVRNGNDTGYGGVDASIYNLQGLTALNVFGSTLIVGFGYTGGVRIGLTGQTPFMAGATTITGAYDPGTGNRPHLAVKSTDTVSVIRAQNSYSGSTISDGLGLELVSNVGYLWNYENGPLILGTNNTTALTLSETGVATFASSVKATRLGVGPMDLTPAVVDIQATDHTVYNGGVLGINGATASIYNLSTVPGSYAQLMLTNRASNAAWVGISAVSQSADISDLVIRTKYDERLRIDGATGAMTVGGSITVGSFPSGPTVGPLNIKTDGSGTGFTIALNSTEYTRFISGGSYKGLMGNGSVPMVVSSPAVKILTNADLEVRNNSDNAYAGVVAGMIQSQDATNPGFSLRMYQTNYNAAVIETTGTASNMNFQSSSGNYFFTGTGGSYMALSRSATQWSFTDYTTGANFIGLTDYFIFEMNGLRQHQFRPGRFELGHSGSNGVYSGRINVTASGIMKLQSGDGAGAWTDILTCDYNSGLIIRPFATVTPANNNDMQFELTSNTQLKVKVKGSDGVVRSASLTLT